MANRRPPKPPSNDSQYADVRLKREDLGVVIAALEWSADRMDGAAGRMRGLAPELARRARKIRRIASTMGAEMSR